MSRMKVKMEVGAESMPREHTSATKGHTFPQKTTGPIGGLLPKVTVAVKAPVAATGTTVSVKKPKPKPVSGRIREQNGM